MNEFKGNEVTDDLTEAGARRKSKELKIPFWT